MSTSGKFSAVASTSTSDVPGPAPGSRHAPSRVMTSAGSPSAATCQARISCGLSHVRAGQGPAQPAHPGQPPVRVRGARGVHRPDLGVRQDEELPRPRSRAAAPRRRRRARSPTRPISALPAAPESSSICGAHALRADRVHPDAGVAVRHGHPLRERVAPRAWSRRTAPRRGWSAARPPTRSRRRCRAPREPTAAPAPRAARTCAMTLTCHEVSQARSAASARPPRATPALAQ